MTDQIREFYQEGNILWSGYWRQFELVQSYAETKVDFMVTVIFCDEQGNPLPFEAPRTHCTRPWRVGRINGDRIVSRMDEVSA